MELFILTLPFVCLLLHLSLQNKTLKLVFAAVQQISAGITMILYVYLVNASGGADDGQFFLQIVLPELILALLLTTGVYFFNRYRRT